MNLTDMPERFRSKVEEVPGGCWRWTAGTKSGYGWYAVERGGYNRCAHQVTYAQLHGDPAAGLVLDHFLYPQGGCIGPPCCNPTHVRPVTRRENALRSEVSRAALNLGRKECPSGHPYDVANTAHDSKGNRVCRTCRNARSVIVQRAKRLRSRVPTEGVDAYVERHTSEAVA